MDFIPVKTPFLKVEKRLFLFNLGITRIKLLFLSAKVIALYNLFIVLYV